MTLSAGAAYSLRRILTRVQLEKEFDILKYPLWRAHHDGAGPKPPQMQTLE